VPFPAVRPRVAVLSLLILPLLALPAQAVIQKLLPLKDVLEGEQLIFTVSIDSIAPDKPGAIFKLDEKLKGEPPFERLAVNLTGDDEAKKDDHTKMLLERLDPSRKAVLFASKKGKKFNAMGFVEGTWFSLQGSLDDDGKTVRWQFLHCEPYLRRTYAGSTADLTKIIKDGLAKKAEPPGVNEKEKPGFGPPSSKKCGTRNAERGTEDGFRSAFRVPSSALFGVMPSLALIGPMAIIAALFPGVAARMAVGMKRWRAFLVIASTNSTLALVYWFLEFKQWLPDTWLAGYKPFTAILLISTAIGLLWAGLRYRRQASDDPALTGVPAKQEVLVLGGLTLFVGLIVASSRLFADSWNEVVNLPMREFTIIGVSLFVATLYAAYRIASAKSDLNFEGTEPPVRLSLSGESVALGTLFLGTVVALCLGGSTVHQVAATGTEAGDAGDVIGPKLADVRVFEIADVHQVMSNGITVHGDRLYFGAAKPGLSASFGSVFCLDRNTGGVHWKFDNDEDLNPVYCTPTVANGKVFVGEGLHTDKGCRLFCLDAASGKPAWTKPFETTSHTEGNPRVVGNLVYFTAGDDGLFCADAGTGQKKWQFAGRDQQLHIDGPPAVAGNRVFVGSGLYTTALLAVDANTGQEVWRAPVNLRSFGAPLVIGNRVVYGLGTGNMGADTFKYAEEKGKDEETAPAGAVVCLEAENGHVAWRYDLSRSVHTSLAADAFSVYATSRDGAVHCLDRKTGKLRWKTGIGATITAGPAVASPGGYPLAVYAISTEGMMVCLNPHTGRPCWSRGLREHTKKLVEDAFATPGIVTEATPTGSRRVIYAGAMLKNPNNNSKAAAVFRFEDELSE
jgi:outer membrane protein assembly factor BamB